MSFWTAVHGWSRVLVLIAVFCLFAALFGRLWYLQGVEANTVAVKSVAGQGI